MQKYIFYFSGIVLSIMIIGSFYYVNEIRKQDYEQKIADIKIQNEKVIIENETKNRQEKEILISQQKLLEENSRISKGELCLNKARDAAAFAFDLECMSDPKIGGSRDKCVLSDQDQIIRYIRYAKSLTFGIFVIDKQLSIDEGNCTKLYGK